MDVVVTVPRWKWAEWVAEGDLPGEPETGQEYFFSVGRTRPDIDPGERVYVVAHNRLRGYSPLVRLELGLHGRWYLVRRNGAVAVTIPEPIRGFRGWRYRWWQPTDEVPFPNWRQP